MNLGLKNKVAIITGGSKGIGKGIAMCLAKEGVNVALVARDEESLNQTAEEILFATNSKVLTFTGDLTKASLANTVCESVASEWGQIDILINNGGGPPPGSFLDHDDEVWQHALDLNLLSAIRFTRKVTSQMIERKWGRIINITSTLAKEPSSAMVLSATARAGVCAFAKSISHELAPHRVTINTLCPGGVRTQRLISLFETIAKQQDKDALEMLAYAEKSIPIGYFAEPEEFAQIVVFLSSEAGSYITGATIMIDGGLTKSIF